MATIINNSDVPRQPLSAERDNSGLAVALIILAIVLIALFAFDRGSFRTVGANTSTAPAITNSQNSNPSNSSGGTSGGSSNSVRGQGSANGQGRVNY